MINIISSDFSKIILLVLTATVISCGEPPETAGKKEPSLQDKPAISPTPPSSASVRPAVKTEEEETAEMKAPKGPAVPPKKAPSPEAQMNKCVNELLAETIGTEPPSSAQAKEAKKACAKKLGIVSLP